MKKIIIALMLLFSLPVSADKLLKNMINQVEKVNPVFQPVVNFTVEKEPYVMSPKAYKGNDIILLFLYDTRKTNANPEIADAAAIFLRDNKGKIKLFTLAFGKGEDIIKQTIVIIFEENK